MDINQQLRAAVTDAIISRALEDPWIHALMSTEIDHLSSIVTSLKKDFDLIAHDLWDFDELNLFHGGSIDTLLLKEWRRLEVVRPRHELRARVFSDLLDRAHRKS